MRYLSSSDYMSKIPNLSEILFVSKIKIFQSIRDFKTRYVLIIKYVSTTKETLGALGKGNNFLKYAFSSYNKIALTKSFKSFHVSHN